MSDKIPTAEEILIKHSSNVATKVNLGYELSGKESLTVSQALLAMKEYGDNIRIAALEAAAENAETYEYPYMDACSECGHTATYIDRDTILNAYPKENIK